jgi:hypothetical protein
MANRTYRVPVSFGEAGTGKRKRKKNVILVLERIRNLTGLPRARENDLLSEKRSKNGEPRRLRGHKDNAVKVWLGGVTRKGHKKYLSVPYPANATVRQISAFVKTKIRGAKTFTMPSGQTYSVGQ